MTSPLLPPRLRGWGLLRLTLNVTGLFCAWKLTNEHLFSIYPSSGPSMFPTLHFKGDAILVSKLHKYGRGVEVGDMVTIRNPGFLSAAAGKRVIGMPGDFVVKDEPLDMEVGRDGVMIQVPEGHVFLAGDNLPWSRDSRQWGPVPLGLVTGKVIARVWPLTKYSRIKNSLEPAQFEEPESESES